MSTTMSICDTMEAKKDDMYNKPVPERANGSSADDGSVLLRIRDLRKSFDDENPVLALDGVGLDVEKGDFVAIVGPSGCGKTTLLRIIAGLEAATRGTIEFAGTQEPDLGFVFQEPTLMPWRTAIENTALVPELRGVPEKQRLERAHAALVLAGLDGYEHLWPRQLSGGMRHRVALARSLAQDPDVLLLDEPFAALDVLTRAELGFELRRIWRETKKTILYVTHDLSEAVLLANRVAIMRERPGSIAEVLRVDLPEQRDEATRDTPQFIALRRRVHELIGRRTRDVQSAATQTQGSPAGRIRSKRGLRLAKRLASFLLLLLAFAGFWRLAVWVFGIPQYLVPPPEMVALRYVELAGTSLWVHTAATFVEAVLGFGVGSLGGFWLGMFLAKSYRLRPLIMPYIIAAQTTPKLILAPLLVVWFGYGLTSKITLAALITFFPVMINVIVGFEQVPRDLRELMVSTGARKRQILAKLEFPAILPELFASLRTAITLGVVGATVGELVGARRGLGYFANYAATYFDTSGVFVAITQLALLGAVLYGAVVLAERRIAPWMEGQEQKGRARGPKRTSTSKRRIQL